MTFFRSTRHVSANGAAYLRNRDGSPLTLEQIAGATPSVMAQEAHESRSAKFSFIPTSEVLAGLMREGFAPVEVRQGGSRIEGKAAFTKHAVRLRHASKSPALVGPGDELFPEIVLYNAHDGTGAYKIMSGAYRVLCANGLVTSQTFEEQKVAHKGDVVGDVIEGAFRVVDQLPRVIEAAQTWAGLRLSHGEQLAFARAAAEIRWEPETMGAAVHSTAPIDPARLLDVRRASDRGDDLWRSFNRVQEGLIQGGQRYQQRDETTRRTTNRTVRGVNSVDQNRAVNRALWTLAEEMQRLKA